MSNLKSTITNLKSAWRWWRNLRQNPVYLREKGGWGRPNPFYDKVNRLSPLLVMAALVIGSCTLYANPAFVGGVSSDFGPLLCLYCLPGIAVSALTLFGSFMAPAVTAPSISSELSQGTWDILRLTPQSTLSILLAKLFGGLSRLPIWTVLAVLTLVQTCFLTFGLLAVSADDSLEFLLIILSGVFLLGRPWIEILFAAFLGMYTSTWIHSETLALATSYGVLIVAKVVVWLLSSLLPLLTVDNFREGSLFLLASSLPVTLYGVATAGLLFGLFHRAQKLS